MFGRWCRYCRSRRRMDDDCGWFALARAVTGSWKLRYWTDVGLETSSWAGCVTVVF